MTDFKSCVICGIKLESILDDWKYLQPYNGGEVRFIFSYGSRMFDLESGNTEFRGIICDTCAAGCMSRMQKTITP